MRSTNLDSRIAVNHQLKELSFQAAENALAHLTSSNANESRPNAIGSENAVLNADYYESTGVDEHQPDLTADVTLELLEISTPGKYKVRGYSLNLISLRYQADSVGRVVGSNTQTTNRMELLFMRN
jgi:Tfp pilus assembly protein PilX